MLRGSALKEDLTKNNLQLRDIYKHVMNNMCYFFAGIQKGKLKWAYSSKLLLFIAFQCFWRSPCLRSKHLSASCVIPEAPDRAGATSKEELLQAALLASSTKLISEPKEAPGYGGPSQNPPNRYLLDFFLEDGYHGLPSCCCRLKKLFGYSPWFWPGAVS